MEQENGSKLLRVVSIIMIIGGIVCAVGSLMMPLRVSVFSEAISGLRNLSDEVDAVIDKSVESMWIGTAFLVISSVIEIIAGVKGKNNWNNPGAANTLIIWGAICVAVALIGSIVSQSFLGILACCVLPVLYIIGALQLKNQAQ